MYSVEMYARGRRACYVDGMSRREAARTFAIDRKTVSKMLAHSVPPDYRRRQARAIIGGKPCKIHIFAMDLPHSDACIARAYRAENSAAFCGGHVAAFAFFGGVPRSLVYDNIKLAVARILGPLSGM